MLKVVAGAGMASVKRLQVVEGVGTSPEPEFKVMTGRKLAVAVELGGVIGARVAPEAGLRR